MSREKLLEYLRIYQDDPSSRVFAPLADQYRKMGNPEEGLKICLEGLQHHPRYAGGRVALAHCYVDLEKFDQAVKEYEFVLAQFPDNLHAIRGAARSYQGLKKFEKALRYYRMYHFLVPKDEIILKQLKSLEAQLKVADVPTKKPPQKASQLQLDENMDRFSALDHYRVSSLTGSRPIQRVHRVQGLQKVAEERQSAGRRIKILYRALQAIQSRRQGQTTLTRSK